MATPRPALDHDVRFEPVNARPIPWKEWLQAAFYAVLVGWVNFYICRELFWNPRAPMNSMHGFWSALARPSQLNWFKSTWWPYWDCGIPFVFTYAPLTPFLTSALAVARNVSSTQAFECLTGLIYCAGPITLFGMAFAISLAWSEFSGRVALLAHGAYRGRSARWTVFLAAHLGRATVIFDGCLGRNPAHAGDGAVTVGSCISCARHSERDIVSLRWGCRHNCCDDTGEHVRPD
jgi:hypothetical protein